MIVKTKPAKKTTTRKKFMAAANGSKSVRTADRAEASEEREEKKHAKVLENVLTAVTAEPVTQHLEEWIQVPCPYCGEEFEVHVTSEEDGQTMYEDCEVCCRPISLHIHIEEGELTVEAYRS